MNNVQKIREQKLMSKAELARRCGLSVLTIDRLERGLPCRMDTMRKVIIGLGLSLDDKDLVFGPDADEESRPASARKADKVVATGSGA
ncbi:MAG: XRE family transcriptional regulator [Myxococcales bacterium]|nr:MAG: XRE family transcriptional regulator [Myxococcales bacterium]